MYIICLSPEGSNTLRWSPTVSPLSNFLPYFLESFHPLPDGRKDGMMNGRMNEQLICRVQKPCFLSVSRKIVHFSHCYFFSHLERFLDIFCENIINFRLFDCQILNSFFLRNFLFFCGTLPRGP